MALFLSEVHKDIQEGLKKKMDYKKRDKPKEQIYTRSTWMRMWSTADTKTIIGGGLLKDKNQIICNLKSHNLMLNNQISIFLSKNSQN